MSETSVPALIIGKPGALRDALQALVVSMPQIGSVDVASEISTALPAVFGQHPPLVLLDADSKDSGTRLMLRQIRTRWPGARCIALVGDVHQQGEAEAAGADAVLLSGLPAERLVAAIVRLLPQSVM